MNVNEITENVGAWLGLVGALVATGWAFVKWRSGVVLVNPSVIMDLQNQNTRLSNDLDDERERRREYEEEVERRFDLLQKTVTHTQERMRSLEKENAKLQDKLGLAKTMLDTAMEWMNEYTPALKAAGIEPLDIDPPKFRGE